MMADNSFSESLRLSKQLFESIELCAEYNYSVTIPNNYAAELRGKSYYDQWKIHSRNFWFNMRLPDQSLLFFEKEDCYRFLMAPIKVPSQDDFLHYEFGGDWNMFSEEEQKTYTSSSEYQIAYQSFIDSTSEPSAYTPIRYDVALTPEDYCKYSHPAFHMHIGFENNSRIPVKYRLTPYAFSVFILATFYPINWKYAVQKGFLKEGDFSKVKDGLENIRHMDKGYWDELIEERRLYFG